MKKLIFLFLFIPLLSCEKEENFAITQIVTIRTLNEIAINCPGRAVTLGLAFDNRTYDEIHLKQKELTYTKWAEPNDTIWLLRNYKDYEGQILNVFYVYPDSTLVESYVKTVLPYYCPEY